MITTAEDLQALMIRAHKTDAVALDTEFVWERTYYPRLGLIQLALSNEECFLIDPCAIDDLTPLGKLLADTEVVKIFHDAPQDLAILRSATGADPQNVFDTKLVAGFTGFPSTLSLAVLIERLLDIRLEKSQTRTNWLKRPLDPKQEEYALDDVRYLRAIRVLLLTRVLPDTRSWMEEELQRFDTPANYTGIDVRDRYLKIKGSGKLNQRSLAILQNLVIWREKEAKKRNRPRGHIVKDPVLLSIARQQVEKKTQIQNCGEISGKSVESYGDAILEIVSTSLNQADSACPPLVRHIKLNKSEKDIMAKFHDFIILKSDIHGIDPPLVGNKSELKELLKSPSTAEGRTRRGWRKQFLAEFIDTGV